MAHDEPGCGCAAKGSDHGKPRGVKRNLPAQWPVSHSGSRIVYPKYRTVWISGGESIFLRKRLMKASTSFTPYSCSRSQTRSHNSVRLKMRPGSRISTRSKV